MILIVDDDAIYVRALRKQLPWESRSVADGQEAVKAAADYQPSVVIMDVHLGDEDGICAIASLKAVCPRVQVIVNTAYYNEDDEDRALDEGAISYLEKGDASLLRLVVESALDLVSSGSPSRLQ